MFEFKPGQGDTLQLDEAIQQALDAAYNEGNIKEIRAALAEFVNGETARLRKRLNRDRDVLREALSSLWPEEFPVVKLAMSEEPVVSLTVTKLRQLGDFQRAQAQHIVAISEQLQELRHTKEVCEHAAQGTLDIAHTTEFKPGHPDWSPLAESIVALRQSAAAAVFMANQRNTRAKKFMDPETFAQTYHLALSEFWAEAEGVGIQTWDELMTEERERAISFARKISLQHAAAMDGNGQEDDPMVLAILEDGNALTKALTLVEELKKDSPYYLLENLDIFLREAFPGQKVPGDRDTALDAPRRATEILQLVGTVAPQMVKMMWEQIVRPTIHVLHAYGIEVLPPGTIVYGAKPNTNLHRPE